MEYMFPGRDEQNQKSRANRDRHRLRYTSMKLQFGAASKPPDENIRPDLQALLN